MLHQSRDLRVFCPEFPVPDSIWDFLLFPTNNPDPSAGVAQQERARTAGKLLWRVVGRQHVGEHVQTPRGRVVTGFLWLRAFMGRGPVQTLSLLWDVSLWAAWAPPVTLCPGSQSFPGSHENTQEDE